MTITFNSAGTPVYGFNTAITATAPTDAPGVGLLLLTGEFEGSDTIATPSGWSALDLVSGSPTVGQTRLFGLQAGGSDTMPAISWGNVWAFAVIIAFNGLDTSFSQAFSPSGRATNQTTNIVGPAVSRTPTQNNSLALIYGQRNKTSTTDNTVYTAPSGFTMAVSGSHSGSSVSFAFAYQIQTTATTIAANTAITGSKAEGTAQASQGIYAGILAAASVYNPYPPTSLGGMNVQVCM